jgi:oligoribonuclease NrnB/cAMP/cGMP phosphodiesterase (DHH superfamily)
MKIFYHNDADGKVAATLVYNTFPFENAQLYPMQYEISFPFNEIKENEVVYILDYSIEPYEMERLLNITENVIWIDHHKTAIAKYKEFPFEITGIRYDGIAGCELTWLWLNNKNAEDRDLIPKTIRMIGDRDVWQFQLEDTKLFYDGFGLIDSNPMSDKMRQLFYDYDNYVMKRCIANGKLISKFKENTRLSSVKGYAYEVEFEGHKGLACNTLDRTSEFFGDRFDDYDFCSCFAWIGDKWSISLYSQKIDVSEIAVKYGGGGHKGASGFSISVLPFKKI